MFGGITGISAFSVSSKKKHGESALFIFLTGRTGVIKSHFLPGFFQLSVTICATFYPSLRKERSGRHK